MPVFVVALFMFIALAVTHALSPLCIASLTCNLEFGHVAWHKLCTNQTVRCRLGPLLLFWHPATSSSTSDNSPLGSWRRGHDVLGNHHMGEHSLGSTLHGHQVDRHLACLRRNGRCRHALRPAEARVLPLPFGSYARTHESVGAST